MVAAQIDAITSDGSGQIAGIPVEAVVPADAITQIIGDEAGDLGRESIAWCQAKAVSGILSNRSVMAAL